MKKKIALLMACVMAFGVAVGSTLAWLTDTTGEVKNTFTDSDINITLTETDTDSTKEGEQHDYQMIPGHTITKDPIVTVKAGSEACWLFVEVTEGNSFAQYMEYSVASKWTKGDGEKIPANVYYQKISAKTTADTDYPVLTDNTVTVKGSVTKAMMETAKTSQPTLTFKAYASQLYKSAGDEFGADEAWHNISDPTDATPYPAA